MRMRCTCERRPTASICLCNSSSTSLRKPATSIVMASIGRHLLSKGGRIVAKIMAYRLGGEGLPLIKLHADIPCHSTDQPKVKMPTVVDRDYGIHARPLK